MDCGGIIVQEMGNCSQRVWKVKNVCMCVRMTAQGMMILYNLGQGLIIRAGSALKQAKRNRKRYKGKEKKNSTTEQF